MRRSLLILVLTSAMFTAAQADDFWSTPRGGANSFNKTESVEHLASAKAFGAGFVRVAIDKWKGKGRDFLAGDFDHYNGLVNEDAVTLREILDGAADNKVKVLLTALGVPGDRWVQHNGNQQDIRIWQDKAWWDHAARYWGDIARTYKGHPAIAGYNVLNEPVPEWKTGIENGPDTPQTRDAWCAKVKGTARDLNGLYAKIVAAIRAEDKDVPIVLDAGAWAKPMAARCLTPIDDPHVLYAMHMYEPWEFTTAPATGNYPRLAYPATVTIWGQQRELNAATTAAAMQPFFDWADAHHIAHNRLLLGEFGCWRQLEGCAAYLKDVLAVAEAQNIHWAFYSWREDGWDAMDYELGSGPTPKGFWDNPLGGSDPNLPRPHNAMSDLLRAALAKRAKD